MDKVMQNGRQVGDFSPSPSYSPQTSLIGDEYDLQVDSVGNLNIRGQVTTDEGSMRDDFSGSALATNITGTCTFTSNSQMVYGTGTAFKSQINRLMYIKVTAHANTAWARVMRVIDDTTIELASPYTGATASGAASHFAKWIQTVGSGGSVAVASSLCNVNSGATSGAITGISRIVDYSPIVTTIYASVSQRVANQECQIGLTDSVSSPGAQATVVFNGTVNTTAIFRTASSSAAADKKETTFSFPSGLLSTGSHEYKIELGQNGATLSVNGTPVATHRLHIPDTYQTMLAAGWINNTGAASNTVLAIDSINVQNVDALQTVNTFNGDPIPTAEAAQAAPIGLFAYNVNSAATTNAAVIKSSPGAVFNVQISNASASARSVKLYDKATAPTVGTDVPIMTFQLPAATSKEVEFNKGTRFGLGIGIAITALPAVTDATAVAASDVQVHIDYA